MKKITDILVIGGGLAGLLYSLEASKYANVVLITKNNLGQSNTFYAQGGIAAVMDKINDSFEEHIKDTIIAGDGLCNEEIVRKVVCSAPMVIEKLVSYGVEFDTKEGIYVLGREGGHSRNRILHHKDITGKEIEQKLVEAVKKNPKIEVFENYYAVDLLTQHHLGATVNRYSKDIKCFGAYVMDMKTNRIHTFLAKITVLATGGIGNIYEITTNPSIATGDGIAMAYRAKAIIENMEFVQFHPTALYQKNTRPAFLITEALRGFGATLRNHLGEEFMKKYDERKNLAPRDIVARAIDNEMKLNGLEHVWLDATHLDKEALIQNFPNIYERCKSIGIDITKEFIPVAPAAHYICGGIKTDEFGRTSINYLYAIGETASTGLHGANRLASNSLLESAAFALFAAEDSKKFLEKRINFYTNFPDWEYKGNHYPEEMVLISNEFKELQHIMSNYVGVVRTNLRLQRALSRLEVIYKETEELYKNSLPNFQILELRNAINTAYLVIKMAINRRESRGLHFNLNYPNKIDLSIFKNLD